MSELRVTTAVTVPQAEPSYKIIFRILWNLKDYFAAVIALIELAKSISHNADSELYYAVAAYFISYSVGKLIFSVIMGTIVILLMMFVPFRIFQLFSGYLLSSKISQTIDLAIENTPLWICLWLFYIAIALGAILGVCSVIFGSFEPSESLSPLFAIVGMLILLSAFYRICRFLQKKMKILTAGVGDS